MFKLNQVAHDLTAQFANSDSPNAVALFASLTVTGIASLKDAGPKDLAFFFSKNYVEDLMKTRAGAVITGSAFVDQIKTANIPAWKESVFLSVPDPYFTMAKATALFSPLLSRHDHQAPSQVSSVHASAVIDPSVKLGKQVSVGAFCVIESGCVIGDHVVIYPHAYLGPNCTVGKQSILFPKVTLYERTRIGERCRIHAGSVLGADGFGYAPVIDPATRLPVDHQKIYHLGQVVIEDDVEIGAGTTIDRGTFGDTRIQKKVKIDNQVQVGHNCNIGEGSVLCGLSGMAGSSSLGKFVILGAQAGTANQVHVGDYARFAAYTGASKDIPAKAEVAGVPARPISEVYRVLAMQNKLLRQKGKTK